MLYLKPQFHTEPEPGMSLAQWADSLRQQGRALETLDPGRSDRFHHLADNADARLLRARAARLKETTDMTLDEARSTRMLFGQHKGRTLQWIGENDVLHLDWLAGLTDIRSQRLADAILLVSGDFAAEIDRAMEEREERHEHRDDD